MAEAPSFDGAIRSTQSSGQLRHAKPLLDNVQGACDEWADGEPIHGAQSSETGEIALSGNDCQLRRVVRQISRFPLQPVADQEERAPVVRMPVARILERGELGLLQRLGL